MKKKRILNSKEGATLGVLAKVLKNSGYRVHTKVRLADVIEPDTSDSLTYEEKTFLLASHLDFIIVSRKSGFAEFAVEFDGPGHVHPRQVRRDIIKNRLTDKSEIPLLRVSDFQLQLHDQMCLLEFMITRFLRHGESISSFSDWGGEAEMGFDLHNQFPGVQLVARRLWDKFRVASIFRIEEQLLALKTAGKVRFCDVGLGKMEFAPLYRHTISYGIYEAPDYQAVTFASAKPLKVKTLHEGEIGISMRMSLPIVEDYDESREAPVEYFLKTGKMPLSMRGIPGVNIPSIAETFAEYLGLRRIEDWIKRQKGNPH